MGGWHIAPNATLPAGPRSGHAVYTVGPGATNNFAKYRAASGPAKPRAYAFCVLNRSLLEPLQVGINHERDQIFESRSGLPPKLGLR